MSGWEAFATLVAGLLAAIFLGGAVCFAQEYGDEANHGIFQMLSAAGIAATALFSIGLIYHLLLQAWLAFHLWG